MKVGDRIKSTVNIPPVDPRIKVGDKGTIMKDRTRAEVKSDPPCWFVRFDSGTWSYLFEDEMKALTLDAGK